MFSTSNRTSAAATRKLIITTKGMNMCTVQSIKDAIRESCQSQYDMESTDIDRVLQTLPFSEHEPMFSHPPKYKRPYRPWQNNKNS